MSNVSDSTNCSSTLNDTAIAYYCSKLNMIVPILYFPCCFVGLCINIFFIATVMLGKKLRKNAFFQLASSKGTVDALLQLIFIIYSLPSSLVGESIFGNIGNAAFGTVVNALWFTGNATLLCQAINRLVVVCLPREYSDTIFSERNCWFFITIPWLVGFIVSIPNIFPVGYQKWNVVYSAWFYDDPDYGFIDTGYTCSILLVVYILHGCVFYFIVKHNKQVQVRLQQSRRDSVMLRKREVKQFLQFFVITMFPFVYELAGNILPYFIASESAFIAFTIFNTVMLIMDAFVNSFIYVVCNETVREEIFAVFPFLLKLKSKRFGSGSTSSTTTNVQPQQQQQQAREAWK